MKKFLMLAVVFIMAFAVSGCSLLKIYNQYDKDSSVEDSSVEDSSVGDSSVEDSSTEDASDWDGWTDFY